MIQMDKPHPCIRVKSISSNTLLKGWACKYYRKYSRMEYGSMMTSSTQLKTCFQKFEIKYTTQILGKCSQNDRSMGDPKRG